MNLIRTNNPWGLMDRLHRDVDRLVSARLLAGNDEQTGELGGLGPRNRRQRGGRPPS